MLVAATAAAVDGEPNKKTIKDDREILYFDRDHLHMFPSVNSVLHKYERRPDNEDKPGVEKQ